MLMEQTLHTLKALRLPGMAAAFEAQQHQAAMAELSFDERFGLLVEREHIWRENRRLTRLLREARLKSSQACVEDIRYAADYLVTLPYVDENRIGALGICGGGAYVLNAAMTERRIKAVTSITGVNFGRMMREGYGGTGQALIDGLEAVAQQRTAEARGAEYLVNDLLPPSVEEAKKAIIKVVNFPRFYFLHLHFHKVYFQTPF